MTLNSSSVDDVTATPTTSCQFAVAALRIFSASNVHVSYLRQIGARNLHKCNNGDRENLSSFSIQKTTLVSLHRQNILKTAFLETFQDFRSP